MMGRGLPPPELRALYQTSPHVMVMVRVHAARGLQDLNSFSSMSPLVRAVAVAECDRALYGKGDIEIEMFKAPATEESATFSMVAAESSGIVPLLPLPPPQYVINPHCGGVAETEAGVVYNHPIIQCEHKHTARSFRLVIFILDS